MSCRILEDGTCVLWSGDELDELQFEHVIGLHIADFCRTVPIVMMIKMSIPV